MKKRLLSVFMVLCLMLAMVPTVAAAEGDPVFTVGENTYSTLAEAINNVGSETTITLSGDFTGESNNVAAIPEGVTLVVSGGSAFNLPLMALLTMVTSEGNIEVEANANLTLNDSSYIGATDDYYFKVLSGSIMLRDFDGGSGGFKMDIVVTEGSTAEIPSSKNVTLQPLVWGTDLTVETGAALTVNGGLRGISGSGHPSAITVNGTLNCTNGFMSLSANATIDIGSTGNLVVGERGIITNSIKEGYPSVPNAYTTTGKISLEKGGSVVVSSENTLNTGLASQITGVDSITDSDGNTIIGVDIVKSESDEARIGNTYYASLDGEGGALASARPGDTIVLIGNATIDDYTYADGYTLDENVTLQIPANFTLTVDVLAGAGLLSSSEGVLEVAAGGTVLLPNSSGTKDNWIGTTNNDRLNLSEGKITYDFALRTLTLEGTAIVPVSQTSYMHLGEGESTGISAVISSGSLTVNGTLNAVSGSKLTVAQGAVLTVSNTGELVVSANADVTVSGTFSLPMLSADAANAIAGDITINDSATVTYSGYEILGGANSLLTLTDGTATLNLSNAASTGVDLTLNSGSATVKSDLRAFLVAEGNEIVPFNVTIAEGSSVTVPENVTLSMVNGSSLTGDITVNGTLELHSTSALTGDTTVNGKVYVFNSQTSDPAINGTFTLGNSGEIYANVNNLTVSGTPYVHEGEYNCTSISSGGAVLKYLYDLTAPAPTSNITVYNASNEEIFNGADGVKFTDVAEALAAPGAVRVLLGAQSEPYTVDTNATVPAGVSLELESGASLTVTIGSDFGYPLLNTSAGKIVVNTGATLNLPAAGSGSNAWIGADDNARLKLTSGNAMFDFGTKTLTINGNATVPSGQEAIMHLNGEPINGVIADGTTLTVEGTLRAISGNGDNGTHLTVNGTLDVNGALEIADKASVEVNGKLDLPLLNSTTAGAMLGDIVINGGASVIYADFATIVGDNTAIIELDDGAKATLNIHDGTLVLNAGEAIINGDVNNELNTRIPMDGGYVYLDVTIEDGATVSVPATKTLNVVRYTSMTIEEGGTLDVEGALTLAMNDTSFTVNGTLELPLMSKVEMSALKGDITINQGATVTYASYPILGGVNAYLTLGADEEGDGSATLNLSNANGEEPYADIKLTSGHATVNGSNGVLHAFLISSPSDIENRIPFHVDITDCGIEIPEGVTLDMVNGSGLNGSSGVVNVNGNLEIHSESSLTGAFAHVRGTVLVFDSATSKADLTGTVFPLYDDGAIYTNNVGDIIVSHGEDEEAYFHEGNYTVGSSTFTHLVNLIPEATVISGISVDETDIAPVEGTTSYTVTVPSDTASVDVTVTFTGDEEVTVNGTPVTSGNVAEVAIADDTTTITVAIGGTTAYTITINRESEEPEPTPEAPKMVGLTVDGGTLTPAFSSETHEYTIFLPYSTASVSMVPYISVDSEISIVGDVTTSGPNVIVTVAPGTYETVQFILTNDAGKTTYTVTVSRASAPVTPPDDDDDDTDTYRVYVNNTANGDVTTSVNRAEAGDTVYIYVDPDTGYELEDISVSDSFGNSVNVNRVNSTTYRFTMPARVVYIDAEFVRTTVTMPFTDVNRGDWFYDAVYYAYTNGLMDGVSTTQFAPNSNLTRGMVVTILYRLEGEPRVTGSSGFTDVASGAWYADPVTWAAANGIVNGVSDTEFAPDTDITREQLAAILFRYAEYKGYDVSGRDSLTGYTDRSSISAYALDAMRWAVDEGLITGMTATTIVPQGTATRAQCATMLMRFIESVA